MVFDRYEASYQAHQLLLRVHAPPDADATSSLTVRVEAIGVYAVRHNDQLLRRQAALHGEVPPHVGIYDDEIREPRQQRLGPEYEPREAIIACQIQRRGAQAPYHTRLGYERL